MKILKYTYIIPILLFTLLFFNTKVNATTSYISQSITVTNGNNATLISTTYPLLEGELVDAEDIQGTSQSWWNYKPNFSLDLDLPTGFISGFLYFDISVSTGLGSSVYSNFEVSNLANGDGIHTNISYVRNNVFRVYVFLDNYQRTNGTTHIGNLTITYQDRSTAYSANASTNFTATLTIVNNKLTKYDVVQNDRTTALLYSAITQATGQELANIISGLAAIQNQDYVYYQQLVTNIAALTQAQNTANADLLLILNELDLDFQQVQTILDLFPSYRTQVLQYWQQLLEMNATQSSAAAELESQYADKDNQSSNLLGDLDSISYPSVNSGDFDIMGNADADAKANFFGLIGLITNNSFVTTVLIIIITGMIAGYALYGKK